MIDKAGLSPSDIPAGNWIDRYAPAATRPYLRLMRLDRPIGTWLLLLPCWWSLFLAAPAFETGLYYAALFALGAVIMRGAGCTINDLADREFDAQVTRTADRPLPSGDVSVRQAMIFLGALLALGLMILVQFNGFAVGVGVASLGLVFIYPFAKRFTYWPQAVLGLTFNWGALVGWAAVTGTLEAPALLLYAGGLFWTLGYDTIYAHQDKEDDLLVGIKSTALKLGDQTRPWLFVFYTLALGLYALAGWTAGLPWLFAFGIVLAGGHLFWQAWRVDIANPKDCLATFKSNRNFGLIFLAAILIGTYLG